MLLHGIHVEGHFNDRLVESVWIECKAFQNDARFVEFRYRRNATVTRQLRRIDS